MAVVRVTRLLEYEYESAERALADMERWEVPPNGSHRFGVHPSAPLIRSAVIGPVVGEAAEQIHARTDTTEESARRTNITDSAVQGYLEERGYNMPTTPEQLYALVAWVMAAFREGR